MKSAKSRDKNEGRVKPAHDRMAPKIDRSNPSLGQQIVLTVRRAGFELVPPDGQAGARLVRATIAFWGHCGAIRKPGFISEQRKVGLRSVSGKANAPSSTRLAKIASVIVEKMDRERRATRRTRSVPKAGHWSVLFPVGERREATSPILIALTLLNRINLLYYL
jgi:hypothetical protein